MGDRFATIDMSSDVNPKPYLGAGVPLSVGGMSWILIQHSVDWAYLYTKWNADPSVWPQ